MAKKRAGAGKKPKKTKKKFIRKNPRQAAGKAPRDEREELFVLEYLKDQNGARAARAAGYSEASAAVIACELLTKPNIKQKVLNALAEQKARVKLEADEILLGIKHLAVADPRRMFNLETGCVLPPAQWPDDLAQAVAGFEVRETRHPFTGELTGYIKKIKFWDKPKSQENLGRNQGLFKDVVDNQGQVTVVQATQEQVDAAAKEFKDKL